MSFPSSNYNFGFSSPSLSSLDVSPNTTMNFGNIDFGGMDNGLLGIGHVLGDGNYQLGNSHLGLGNMDLGNLITGTLGANEVLGAGNILSQADMGGIGGININELSSLGGLDNFFGGAGTGRLGYDDIFGGGIDLGGVDWGGYGFTDDFSTFMDAYSAGDTVQDIGGYQNFTGVPSDWRIGDTTWGDGTQVHPDSGHPREDYMRSVFGEGGIDDLSLGATLGGGETVIDDFAADALTTPTWMMELDRSGLNPTQTEGGFIDPNDRVGESSFIQEFGEWGSQFINDLLGTDQKSQDEVGASGMYELDWWDKYILGKEEFGNYDVSGFKAEDIGDGIQLKSGEGNKARPTVLDDGTPVFIDDNGVLHLRSLPDASTASEAGMTAPPWFFSYDDKGSISGLDDPAGWFQNEVDEFLNPQDLKEFGIRGAGSAITDLIRGMLISDAGEGSLVVADETQPLEEWARLGRESIKAQIAANDESRWSLDFNHSRDGESPVSDDGVPAWEREGFNYFDADGSTRLKATEAGYEIPEKDWDQFETDLDKARKAAPVLREGWDAFQRNKQDQSLLDLNTWNDSLVLQNVTMDNWIGEGGVGHDWFTRAANVSGKDQALGLIKEASGWDKALPAWAGSVGEAPDMKGILEQNAISGALGLDSYDSNLEAQQFNQEKFDKIMNEYSTAKETLNAVVSQAYNDVVDPYNDTMLQWGSDEGEGGKFYNEAASITDPHDSRIEQLLDHTKGWEKLYTDFGESFGSEFMKIHGSQAYPEEGVNSYNYEDYENQIKTMRESRAKLHNLLGERKHGFEGYYEGFDGAGPFIGSDETSQYERGLENSQAPTQEFTGDHNQSLNKWGDQVDNYHERVMNITDINDPSIDGLIAEWQQAYNRTDSYKDFKTKPADDFNYEKYNNLMSRMREARAKLEDLKNGQYHEQWGDGYYTIKGEHYENKIFGENY